LTAPPAALAGSDGGAGFGAALAGEDAGAVEREAAFEAFGAALGAALNGLAVGGAAPLQPPAISAVRTRTTAPAPPAGWSGRSLPTLISKL